MQKMNGTLICRASDAWNNSLFAPNIQAFHTRSCPPACKWFHPSCTVTVNGFTKKIHSRELIEKQLKLNTLHLWKITNFPFILVDIIQWWEIIQDSNILFPFSFTSRLKILKSILWCGLVILSDRQRGISIRPDSFSILNSRLIECTLI